MYGLVNKMLWPEACREPDSVFPVGAIRQYLQRFHRTPANKENQSYLLSKSHSKLIFWDKTKGSTGSRKLFFLHTVCLPFINPSPGPGPGVWPERNPHCILRWATLASLQPSVPGHDSTRLQTHLWLMGEDCTGSCRAICHHLRRHKEDLQDNF